MALHRSLDDGRTGAWYRLLLLLQQAVAVVEHGLRSLEWVGLLDQTVLLVEGVGGAARARAGRAGGGRARGAVALAVVAEAGDVGAAGDAVELAGVRAGGVMAVGAVLGTAPIGGGDLAVVVEAAGDARRARARLRVRGHPGQRVVAARVGPGGAAAARCQVVAGDLDGAELLDAAVGVEAAVATRGIEAELGRPALGGGDLVQALGRVVAVGGDRRVRVVGLGEVPGRVVLEAGSVPQPVGQRGHPSLAVVRVAHRVAVGIGDARQVAGRVPDVLHLVAVAVGLRGQVPLTVVGIARGAAAVGHAGHRAARSQAGVPLECGPSSRRSNIVN